MNKRNLLCGVAALCCTVAMAQKPTDILSVSASSGQEKAALAFDKNPRTMWEVDGAGPLDNDQWLMCTLQTPGDVCGLSLQARFEGLGKQELAQWLQVFVTYDPMNLGEPVAYEVEGNDRKGFKLMFAPKYGAHVRLAFKGGMQEKPYGVKEISVLLSEKKEMTDREGNKTSLPS